MKRYLPFLLMLPLGMYAYACSSNSSDNGGGTTNPPGGEPPGGSSGNPNPPGSSGNPNPGPGTDDPNQNPIDGIDQVKVILTTNEYTDGPIWHAGQKFLFFTTPLGASALYRMRADGTVKKIRDGSTTEANPMNTNTVDPAGNLVTIDALDVVRASAVGDAGAPEMVANGFVDKGTFQKFDSLKNGVVMKDGSMFLTDPGYGLNTLTANRIYRVAPDKTVTVMDSFEDIPRPTGLALNPDQTEVYVGFTQPMAGTLPYIRKYHVNEDGTLGESGKWVDIDPETSTPDGIEVDTHGNVYVATAQGINVYKSDATKIGVIAVPEQPTGMAFGGDDMKTLYITTQGINIWQVKLKVAGIAQ
ncbi:Gluconolactonase [Labilithrix luteola]|uniref:Gluconolactonase n=1 Tax=Labilithrix luteola TaxID=1391654 RepID=A0A0K1Q0F0_9BACT|nr:SMP-30/gluconolactonase/LRE family protein [Labilithrix luteola]AKU99250.1 Gluconolactonase [Labilithrix luteola]